MTSTEKTINAARKRVVDALKEARRVNACTIPYTARDAELATALADLEALETPFEYVILGHVSERHHNSRAAETIVFRGSDLRGHGAEVYVESVGLRGAALRLGVSRYRISITEIPE